MIGRQLLAHIFVFLACLTSLQPLHAQQQTLPITRDTWVSAYRGETQGNNGSDSRLKTKGIIELSLLDFDPRPLRGQVIAKAWLYVKPASNDRQLRVTVSSISSDWGEGEGRRYRKTPGGASFEMAKQDQTPWAWPGSDITAVIAGEGNSFWAMADAAAPDASRYQRIAVAPRVIAARLAQLSWGLAMIDDVGSQYTRQGEKFTYHIFPNRFIHSRHAAPSNRPYLVVETGEADTFPPGPIQDFQSTFQGLPLEQCQVSFTAPVDHGPAGTLGFIIHAANGQTATPAMAQRVPAWLVPVIHANDPPGQRYAFTLRDMALDFTQPVTLYVRAVDAAGNAGPITRHIIPARKNPPPSVTLPQPPAAFVPAEAPLTIHDDAAVFVIDALDKIDPITGQLIPAQDESYRTGNHLWSAATRTIRLHAARGEFVGFQLVMKDAQPPQLLVMQDDSAAPLKIEISRLAYVKTKQGQTLPDPVLPEAAIPPFPVADSQYHARLIEVYVPPHAKPGVHDAKVLVAHGGHTLTLNLQVHVWNFSLPDHLSFVPQMNAYGLGSPATEKAYYRLAHLHRTNLNRLPYNWRGQPQPGAAPALRQGRFDWRAWDARFGPLLDGSAFADLPRKGVPVDQFYLPLNENWPASIEQGFTGGYWADQALTDDYRNQFIQAARAITTHFHEKKWHDTTFEFFLNGKVIFKRNGWSSASSPWLFDEPANTQDFWALRWYGIAFHRGVNQARQQARNDPAFPRMAFRADISRPQWQRDTLDGVLDVNVVGGSIAKYERLILRRQRQHSETLYSYGSTSGVEKANSQPAAWCIDTWLHQGQGVLPWQTMGRTASWQNADSQAVFYPGKPARLDEPVPSLRLKAYRQGQQITEYMTILTQHLGLPRWAIEAQVRTLANMAAPRVTQRGEEAADFGFDDVTPATLWRLRMALGMKLHELAPPDQDRWLDTRLPVRDVRSLPDKHLK